MTDEKRISDETRQEEQREARMDAGPGRMPTPDEEQAADRHGQVDAGVAEHEREMLEKGARQKGEGRIA
jgi:hypothetical protein